MSTEDTINPKDFPRSSFSTTITHSSWSTNILTTFLLSLHSPDGGEEKEFMHKQSRLEKFFWQPRNKLQPSTASSIHSFHSVRSLFTKFLPLLVVAFKKEKTVQNTRFSKGFLTLYDSGIIPGRAQQPVFLVITWHRVFFCYFCPFPLESPLSLLTATQSTNSVSSVYLWCTHTVLSLSVFWTHRQRVSLSLCAIHCTNCRLDIFSCCYL